MFQAELAERRTQGKGRAPRAEQIRQSLHVLESAVATEFGDWESVKAAWRLVELGRWQRERNDPGIIEEHREWRARIAEEERLREEAVRQAEEDELAEWRALMDEQARQDQRGAPQWRIAKEELLAEARWGLHDKD
jgi:hypothetical protein